MTKYTITETNGRYIITDERGRKLGDFGSKDAAKKRVKEYQDRDFDRDYAWLGI